MPPRDMNSEERAQFVQDIAEAIHDSMPSPLTSDETKAVRLLIAKEAQQIAFRKAVIEKTTTALLIAFCIFLGGVFVNIAKEYAVAHGWKP